jgi:4-amino-4-deoxy-L-arabinose transferase-like glycosyltransferase
MNQPSVESSSGASRRESEGWIALFGIVFVWLAVMLFWQVNRPWINGVDYNGAVWSQAAHNILRAGLAETSGASSGFYFGPLPIPAWGYYLHHPPILHLVIAFLFSIFGEHEWVARVVPIGCSLTSTILLWLLVRSCLGIRVATLSAAVFTCLPMQLRYGAMVNFEPCVLMLMLGALLCMRWHRVSGRSGWKIAAFACVVIGLWVDWAMYLFAMALCGCWLLRGRDGDRRFAGVIFLSVILSGGLYLLRIILLRPDAWQNLSHTFMTRLGAGKGGYFTEAQWLERIGHTLSAHFLPVGLILGAAGTVILWRGRMNADYQWLGRATLSILVMDVLFVAIFQNDSYIHEYIAFYLLAPVSIAAGVALETLIIGVDGTGTPARLSSGTGTAVACLVVAGMGWLGFWQSEALVRQFRILDYHADEPAELIPELGRAIRANFSAETHVLCNFLPDYGPQLAYYAQRDILNNLSEYRFWAPHLKDSAKPVGGVVWVSQNPFSGDILARLPAGPRKFLTVGDLTFCLWKRDGTSKLGAN